MYKAVKKERGANAAVFLLLICLFFVPYYLMLFKLYSDTMSLPFAALSLMLMVYA